LLENKVSVLGYLIKETCGVKELAENIVMHPKILIETLRELERDGHIAYKKLALSRGRPKKVPVITGLGCEFMKSYRELQSKRLKINRNDVKRAVLQAELAEKLVAKGISPYNRFLELTDIVLNIRNTP
jgi:DNA-binding HxlR family transcriptional regulator